MFPGKKQPDFAKKAALEKEVVDVLETYGKRLRAVRRTMDDIKKKKNELRESAEVEVTLIRQMDDLRCENENALGRLRENIGIAAKSADPNTDVLGSVWNITRMKVIYHPVLKGAFESSSICNGWKRRPSVLEAMEKHNQEIFGRGKNDIKNYISVFSYPSIVKDHLFNIRNILEKYNKSTKCSALKRVADLISWLDREQPTLTSIKGFTSAMSSNTPDEVVLQKSRMRLPVCDHGDASSADLILSKSLVAVRTLPRRIFGKGVLEYQAIKDVNVEEGVDDLTLHVLGVGFRKVLIADNRERRDEWLTSFKEIKEGNRRIST